MIRDVVGFISNPIKLGLALLFFVIVGYLTLEINVSRIYQQYSNSTNHSENLLGDGFEQNQFVQRVRAIVEDNILISNILMGLENSSRQALRSHLLDSQLDHIWVFDSNCSNISYLGLTTTSFNPCSNPISTKPLLDSQLIDQSKFQLFYFPVDHLGKKLLIVGARSLNQKSITSNYIPYSAHDSIQKKRLKNQIFLGFCAIFSVFFLLVAWFRYLDKINQTKKILRRIRAWISFRTGLACEKIPEENYQHILTTLDYIYDNLIQQIEIYKSEDDFKSQKIKKLTSKIQNLYISNFSSVGVEKFVRDTSKIIKQNLNIINDFEVSSRQKISLRITPSLEVVQRWECGIEERGARKFLRSLSETKSGTRHSDLLMFDLSVIKHTMQSTIETLTEAQVAMHEVAIFHSEALKRCENTLGLLNFDLSSPLAKSIVVLQENFKNESFCFDNNLLELSLKLSTPKDIMALLALIYDLFSKSHKNEFVNILTNYHNKHDRHVLIIDADFDKKPTLIDEDIKRKFLQDCDFIIVDQSKTSISFSPTLNSLPIILQWQILNEKNIDIIRIEDQGPIIAPWAGSSNGFEVSG